MSNNPDELVRLLRLRNEVDDGTATEAELYAAMPPRRIGDAAVLVVPPTVSAAVWEATWSDPEANERWAVYMEHLRIKYDLPLPPEPVIIETPPPVSQSRSLRHDRTNPIKAALRSLAGARSLRR